MRALTDNDRDVIRERHFGWERASFALLAAVFGVHANTIAAICREPTNHTPCRNADAHQLAGAGLCGFVHNEPNTLGEAQDHV